jgi:hypothetical protein
MTPQGIAAVLCLIALLAIGDVRARKPTRTITGIVKSAEIYGGKVRSVYIADPEEGRFLVARGTDLGKELRGYVGSTVRAMGYVRKSVRDADFEFVIDVLHYEIDLSDEPVREVKVEAGRPSLSPWDR